MTFWFELLDPRLVLVLVLVSIPLVLYVGARRFGSLSELWNGTRAMFGSPREFAEDTARDVFTPWGAPLRPRGSLDIWMFWLVYWLMVLAAYSIVQHVRRHWG